MKLAVVTPRYGTEIPGGAETAARLLATRLAQDTEWAVEVLTTCASDASTWANHYAPGAEVVDGVPVQRFPVARTRAPDFDAATDEFVRRGMGATGEEQQKWLQAQGPYAPQLVDAIAASDADAIAFHPYLYHPTVAGLARVSNRSVLHPAAHDEPPLRFSMYTNLFEDAAALGYWSEPERALVQARFAISQKPAAVVGLGTDARDGDAAPARVSLSLDDRPFLLCLGRVDDGKGATLLAQCFTAYKDRRSGPLQLVFAGPVAHRPASHPDIVVAGAVDEAVKWGLLRGALALVTPSAFESFSIVLMEAWAVGTPALVNRRCAVTRDHAERSGGALAFGSYAELEVALDRLTGSPALAAALGTAGRAYVNAYYRWPDVVARYTTLISQLG
jgi:glycosyltransferase involved in cell wall biosynthesis